MTLHGWPAGVMKPSGLADRRVEATSSGWEFAPRVGPGPLKARRIREEMAAMRYELQRWLHLAAFALGVLAVVTAALALSAPTIDLIALR